MSDGTPKVIEYNCRFGDPETQPIMLRLKSDLVDHCLAAIEGKLDTQETLWDSRTSVGVVLAAGGYPGSYQKGHIISGLQPLETGNNAGNVLSEAIDEKIFHAGTVHGDNSDNGPVLTNGGRVLCATALGDTISDAQQQAYKLASTISWEGMFYREDIAWRAIAREQKE